MNEHLRNIGIKVKNPTKQSTDKHDPFFGNLSIRGRIFTGTIISIMAQRTAKIEFERLVPIPKYERYEKRRTRLFVHIPDSLSISVGDVVRVAECRPISKTKNFVIIEKLEK